MSQVPSTEPEAQQGLQHHVWSSGLLRAHVHVFADARTLTNMSTWTEDHRGGRSGSIIGPSLLSVAGLRL